MADADADAAASEPKPMPMPTVAGSAAQCLESFQQCLVQASSVHPREHSMIEDQSARFSTWAISIGVFALGRASMDHRLRYAPEVQSVVIGLLESLDYRLQTCSSILTGLAKSEATEAQNPPLNEAFGNNYRNIVSEISRLSKISNTIRRASKEAQSFKASEFRVKDDDGNDIEPILLGHFEHHISDRFPGITDTLRRRLARAMLLRWKRVLHRRRRQAVTTVQVPETVSKALDTVQVPKIVSKAPLDTFQATRPQDQKANQVSPVAEAIVAPSQVESATTLAPDKFKMAVLSPSNISTSKTVSLGNHEALNFPSAPGLAAKRKYERRKAEWEADLKAELDKLDELHTAMGSLEDPLHRPLIAEDQAAVKTKFQSILKSYLQEIGEITCPYCLYALPAEEVFDERRWQNHVKNDLDPYVCLFEDCDKPDELYTHSEGWLSHLHQHGQHWLCSSHRQLGRLRTREEYIQHLRETHGANLSDAQLHALASRSARKTVNLFPSCPLCGQDETNVEGRLEDHITGHLRSLALKSLPSYQDDMPDGDGSGRDIDSSAPRSRSTVKNMGEEEDSVAFRTEGFWDHWNPPLREINPTNFLGEPHIELSPTQIISWDLGPLLSQDLFGSLEDDPILQTMVQRSKGKNKKVKVSARKEGKQPSIAKIAEWVEAITDAQVKNQIQVDRKVDSVQEGMARLERNARENPDAEFVREATIRETTDVETSGERLEEDVPGKESEDTAATVRAPEQKDKDVTVSKVKVQQETTDRIAAEGTKKPEIATIKFKDAVGRKFTFPLHICRTWSEMENLIHQAFMGINVLGPRVQAGEFDLLGPNGEIILPQDWEKVVQPGWYIIMVMRPTEELDLAPPPAVQSGFPAAPEASGAR